MPEEEAVEETEETAEMSDKLLPGACFQNFSTTAAECKVCFVAEDCETKTKANKAKKAKEAEAATKKPKKAKKAKKKDLTAVLVDEIGETLVESYRKESEKSLLYGFAEEEDGPVLVKINILKASGKMKVTIDGEDEVLGPLADEEEAMELAERVVESVGE